MLDGVQFCPMYVATSNANYTVLISKDYSCTKANVTKGTTPLLLLFIFFFFEYLMASSVRQLILFCPPLCLQAMQPVPATALVLSVRYLLFSITQGKDGPRPCTSCLSCGSRGVLQLCLLRFVLTAVLLARPTGALSWCPTLKTPFPIAL